MSEKGIRYFVFDVESVADGDLVSSMRYPGEGLSAEDAVQRYRAELMDQYDSDFIPYTFQVPVSVVVGKVAPDLRLVDLVALDEPQFRPHVITELFWRGWTAYEEPTLVSFNGRSFDLPLLELAAFRFGVSIPDWFNSRVRSYEQPRNRYNQDSHFDLHELLTNYGACRFKGGLNLAAQLIGKPGKMGVQGYMVQDLYDDGRLSEINDYCRCDVLDTYFVFLRSSVLQGKINLDQERALVEEARGWLEARVESSPAFANYLEHWGDWPNPWADAADRESPRGA